MKSTEVTSAEIAALWRETAAEHWETAERFRIDGYPHLAERMSELAREADENANDAARKKDS